MKLHPFKANPFDSAVGMDTLVILATLAEARRTLKKVVHVLNHKDKKLAFDAMTNIAAIDRVVTKDFLKS